ncbi:unannotated protein [freshwater metagenome]|uniref:Unannotated protein n=1 Tax=freshwater metagenome TaxID=449393 RepID=A0A6J6Y8K1_9ZZZZ
MVVVPADAISDGSKFLLIATSAATGTGVLTEFVLNVSVMPRPSVAATVAKLAMVVPLALGRILAWNVTSTSSPGPMITGGFGEVDGRKVSVLVCAV